MTAETPFAHRYTLRSRLGEGGLGTVDRAFDAVRGAEVALKRFTRRQAGGARAAALMQQEFRRQTEIVHPNCCRVHDYGVWEGMPYLTMEVVPGEDLAALLPLSPERAVPALGQLLLALHAVHVRGYVHRDVKAANVRLLPDGSLKLMDFGLMARVGEAPGALAGTLAYLAPEAARLEPLDGRVDLYAVGVLAYELLTGRPPFAGDTPRELLAAHADAVPAFGPVARAGAGPELQAWIARLLAKRPEERFASALDACEALGFAIPEGLEGTLLVPPLTGHAATLAEAETVVSGLAAGRPAPLWGLTGPPGAGKTRLLEALRVRAQLAGFAWTRTAFRPSGAAPYAAFTAALRALLPELAALVPEALEANRGVLVKLLPELGGAPADALDSAAREKLRLQAAIWDVLKHLARKKPVVLTIENWHWADAYSVEALRYVARQAERAPLWLIVTSRQALAGGGEGGIEFRALAPLSAPEAAAFVSGMLGGAEPPEPFVARLLAETAALPGALEAALVRLVAERVLVRERTGWAWPEAWHLPPAAPWRSAWEALAAKLAPADRRVAEVASVAGDRFAPQWLASALDLPFERVLEVGAALAQAGLWSLAEPESWAFEEPAFRHHLYDGLPTAGRLATHARIAHAMLAELNAEEEGEASHESLEAIARHFQAGGQADLAIVYGVEAARRMGQIFAHDSAARLAEGALALIASDVPGRWPAEEAEVRCVLGDVFRLTGREPEAVAHYEAVLALMAESGSELEAWVRCSLAKALQIVGKLERALGEAEHAIRLAEACGAWAGAARARSTAARIAFFRQDAALARAHAEQGVASARRAGSALFEGELVAFMGYLAVAGTPPDYEGGVEALQRAVALLERADDKIGLMNAYSLLGNALVKSEDARVAWVVFKMNETIAEEIHAQDDLLFARLNLALCARQLARWGEVRALTDLVVAGASEGSPKPVQLSFAMLLRGVAQAAEGELPAALEAVREGFALAEAQGNAYLLTEALPLALETLLRASAFEAARTLASPHGGLDAILAAHPPLAELWRAHAGAAEARIAGRLARFGGGTGPLL